MKVLIVSKYKPSFKSGIMPFVEEQAESLRSINIEINYFPIRGNGIYGYFKNRKNLINKIAEFKPDIIHAHYGLSGALAVLQKKVPVVITFHNGEVLNTIVNLISSIASLFSTHNIYVAEHIFQRTIFKQRKSFSILPCGVNLSDYTPPASRTELKQTLGLQSDTKYILFGGAFSNLRKNYPLLKDALDILNRKDIQVIEMKGLNRPEIINLMFACDIFVLPSKSEGSPQALKEAMAANCPVIATDIADIKRLIADVEGCYICSFNPNDLAEKISMCLIKDERILGFEQLKKLGLDNSQVALKLKDIYTNILVNKL